MRPKCVLAYSGGLDTSVAIRWLHEQYGFDVVTLTVDLGGQDVDLEAIRRKALAIGAVEAVVVDAREEFAREAVVPALWANALYEHKYALSTALGRPIIARHLVEVARAVGARHVAHGCTGKGNDQVRLDVSVAALDPSLHVVAPVREWRWSRDEEIEYARRHGIPVPVTHDSPYSVDANLFGRSIEGGVLEDPDVPPPEEVFAWTADPRRAPDEPDVVEVEFAHGVPVGLDGRRLGLVELVEELNRRAGAHGVGRVDHVESRLVGIKSREVYELPAATVLVAAHRELECLTLPRELLHFKIALEHRFAELVYGGLWFHPLREALTAFFAAANRPVTGTVRLELYKGAVRVLGRRSPCSLYRHDLATYAAGDRFDAQAAVGFIELYGLPARVFAEVHRGAAAPAAAASVPTAPAVTVDAAGPAGGPGGAEP